MPLALYECRERKNMPNTIKVLILSFFISSFALADEAEIARAKANVGFHERMVSAQTAIRDQAQKDYDEQRKETKNWAKATLVGALGGPLGLPFAGKTIYEGEVDEPARQQDLLAANIALLSANSKLISARFELNSALIKDRLEKEKAKKEAEEQANANEMSNEMVSMLMGVIRGGVAAGAQQTKQQPKRTPATPVVKKEKADTEGENKNIEPKTNVEPKSDPVVEPKEGDDEPPAQIEVKINEDGSVEVVESNVVK